MDLFSWLLPDWMVISWGILILVMCIAIWVFLGRRFSLPAFAIGAVILAYLNGRKIERDNQRKRAQDIEENREKVYAEIDARNTDRDDVLGRLRKGDY